VGRLLVYGGQGICYFAGWPFSKDTQEALNALVVSNIFNLGLILTMEMIIYLIVSR